jgi:hypothetical protein
MALVARSKASDAGGAQRARAEQEASRNKSLGNKDNLPVKLGESTSGSG